jgi:hypothetical protein
MGHSPARYRVWLYGALVNARIFDGVTAKTNATPADSLSRKTPSPTWKTQSILSRHICASRASMPLSLTLATVPSTTTSRPERYELVPVVSTQRGLASMFFAFCS